MTEDTNNLARFAWLSIAVAVLTIALKAGAYFLTGSVSLLSDAMESVVNLVAAIVALFALKAASAPASSRYTFGRSKAEYFSAAIEGAMIFGAAALIIFAAITRIINPIPVAQLNTGLVVSGLAALLNGAVGYYLLRSGRRFHSPTLVADGKHLLTDLITSVGVIIGLIAVIITDWQILDPIIAIVVGLNITRTGVLLLRESLAGLMDVTLPPAENQAIIDILNAHTEPEKITFHGLQTRSSGRLRFVTFHLQVPDNWTVKRGHDLSETLEHEIQAQLENTDVVIHIEPIKDETSYQDIPEGYIPLDGSKDIPQ
ncbi:MAG: cation diffusion facilitator family transporter [Trueperella sp.]|nr:cation diffusion facilitator family transporter [Trueperella sp.]